MDAKTGLLRVPVLAGVFAANVATPGEALGPCESCYIGFKGNPPVQYTYCDKNSPFLEATDDCHDDDDECHQHGQPCS
jgi:hypothetical protein